MLLAVKHVSAPPVTDFPVQFSTLQQSRPCSPRSYSAIAQRNVQQHFGVVEDDIGSTPGSFIGHDQYFPSAPDQTAATPNVAPGLPQWAQWAHPKWLPCRGDGPQQAQDSIEQLSMLTPGGHHQYAYTGQMNHLPTASNAMWTDSIGDMTVFDNLSYPQSSNMTLLHQRYPEDSVLPSSQLPYQVSGMETAPHLGFSNNSSSLGGSSHTTSSVCGQTSSSFGSTKRKLEFLSRRASSAEKTADEEDLEEKEDEDKGDDDEAGQLSYKYDRKRQRFLARNRVAATRCRQKKKDWTTTLEERARILSAEQQHLHSTVNTLRQEVLALKCQCLGHVYCECKRIREYLDQTVAVMKPHRAVYEDKRLDFMSNEDMMASAAALKREAQSLRGMQNTYHQVSRGES